MDTIKIILLIGIVTFALVGALYVNNTIAFNETIDLLGKVAAEKGTADISNIREGDIPIPPCNCLCSGGDICKVPWEKGADGPYCNIENLVYNYSYPDAEGKCDKYNNKKECGGYLRPSPIQNNNSYSDYRTLTVSNCTNDFETLLPLIEL